MKLFILLFLALGKALGMSQAEWVEPVSEIAHQNSTAAQPSSSFRESLFPSEDLCVRINEEFVEVCLWLLGNGYAVHTRTAFGPLTEFEVFVEHEIKTLEALKAVRDIPDLYTKLLSELYPTYVQTDVQGDNGRMRRSTEMAQLGPLALNLKKFMANIEATFSAGKQSDIVISASKAVARAHTELQTETLTIRREIEQRRKELNSDPVKLAESKALIPPTVPYPPLGWEIYSILNARLVEKQSKSGYWPNIDKLRQLILPWFANSVLNDEFGGNQDGNQPPSNNFNNANFLSGGAGWANVLSSRFSPLQLSCVNGDVEAIKLLVSLPGVEVNKAAPGTPTPLKIASALGFLEAVKILVSVPEIEVNKFDQNAHVNYWPDVNRPCCGMGSPTQVAKSPEVKALLKLNGGVPTLTQY